MRLTYVPSEAEAAKSPTLIELACARCKDWAEGQRRRVREVEAREAALQQHMQIIMQKQLSQTLNLCVVAPSAGRTCAYVHRSAATRSHTTTMFFLII